MAGDGAAVSLRGWGRGTRELDEAPRPIRGRRLRASNGSVFGRPGQELSRALLANRKRLAEAFAAALALMPRWKQLMDREQEHWDDFIETQFFAFPDYLAAYFATGDQAYQKLFIGEKLKSLYDAEGDDELRQAQTEAVNAAERSGLEAIFASRLSPGAWQLFAAELAGAHRVLEARSERTQRVLLIGDCLFLDIVPFMVGQLLEAGIKLVVDYAPSKNRHELHQQLRRLSAKKFDLVFFSPFSYEFVADYAGLAHWRQAFIDQEVLEAVVDTTWSEARATLDLVADLFDAPVHVHNSASIIREKNGAKRLMKLKLTAKVRGRAKRKLNGLLDAYVAQRNGEGLKQLFVVDEDRLAQEFGEHRAGAYYYRTALQHPAVFGRVLASRYVDIIFVNAHLARKKLIVCDLDNTLWEGVIGDGPVRQHHNRQEILKGLKARGVLLAINSKNDPANVHWRGATLSEVDFVHSAISWGLKTQGMKWIQSDLNLGMKDVVFIDDRRDELELMRLSYPEVLCLDALDSLTWSRLDLWRDLLQDDPEMDRTQLYRQREQRNAFVREDLDSDQERTRLLRSLGLKLTIARAKPADLSRVAELINRTNQFNLEGSRTTFKEVNGWRQSASHVVLKGQTSDRFGDMGTTCVAVARIDGSDMRLLPFVLSCRVFGYGIERGVMNHLKDLAAKAGVKRIIGRYLPTPQNAPCKDFLADNGFELVDGLWIFVVGDEPRSTAEWLEVSEA